MTHLATNASFVELTSTLALGLTVQTILLCFGAVLAACYRHVRYVVSMTSSLCLPFAYLV